MPVVWLLLRAFLSTVVLNAVFMGDSFDFWDILDILIIGHAGFWVLRFCSQRYRHQLWRKLTACKQISTHVN